MKTIDIIGFDGRDWSTESIELLRNADIVAAGKRILAALPPELSARKVPLGGNLAAELESLLRQEPDARLVVAASGDPLLGEWLEWRTRRLERALAGMERAKDAMEEYARARRTLERLRSYREGGTI